MTRRLLRYTLGAMCSVRRTKARQGLLLLALLGFTPSADANIIDLTQVTLGPSATLIIGDATIVGIFANGTVPGPLVATQAGIGLGLVGVGSESAVDRTITYGIDGGSTTDGLLRIAVDGVINSVTIQPFLEVSETSPPVGDLISGIEVSYVAYQPDTPHVRFNEIFATLGGPFTIQITPTQYALNTLELGLLTEFTGRYGPLFLSPYGSAYQGQDAMVHWGYSVTSLDYTPTGVPEPATLTSIGVGLIAVGAIRRRARRHHSAAR